MRDEKQYEDMLYLPHHVSSSHPPMKMEERAAQFSPFAALSGYGDAIREAGRFTERRTELDEEEKEELDRTLGAILGHMEKKPGARVLYYRPDEKKEGGSYETAEGRVERLDMGSRALVMEDGTRIGLDDILELDGPIWD